MNTETLHFKFLKVFCCVLLLQLGWSHALGAVTEANQTRQIQGVITDSQGETLPGVNVIVKGTSIGAISDLDGKFTLQVPSPKSVLVISYVGYETYEVIVGNKTSFNIVLEDQMSCGSGLWVTKETNGNRRRQYDEEQRAGCRTGSERNQCIGW